MAPLLLLSFKIRRTHLCPPRPPELDRTVGPLDFMLASLVGNGAAWSVATLPAIKLNSHPSRRLVKVPLLESLFGVAIEIPKAADALHALRGEGPHRFIRIDHAPP